MSFTNDPKLLISLIIGGECLIVISGNYKLQRQKTDEKSLRKEEELIKKLYNIIREGPGLHTHDLSSNPRNGVKSFLCN